MTRPGSFRCDGCGKISSAIELAPLCARCRKVMPAWGQQLMVEPEDDDAFDMFAMLMASVLVFAGLAAVIWYFVL